MRTSLGGSLTIIIITIVGFIVSAKSGDLHHTRIQQAELQGKFISFLKQGIDRDSALAAVGKKPSVMRSWMADSAFVKRMEDAILFGAESLSASLGSDKHSIDFATFSKEFLNTEVFAHQQNWVDVLEGREPSWMHDSMIFEQGNRRRLLVNVPPEHAKSTTMTVNYATYRIAMNPNIRIVIISQTQTRAKEFLYSIKQRLTEEPWLKMQQVYGPPGGYKETADQWTADRIYLERTSGEKDPTVQALGIGQQIYGTRADLIIMDDIVSTLNAHEWEKQLNWLQKMVITRVGSTGTLLIAGTRVSSVDLYKEIRNPEHWTGGKSPFTYLAMPAVLKFNDKPEKWVTLWPRADRPLDGADEFDDPELVTPDDNGHYIKWDGRRLFDRRSEVSPSTWALVYQQQDVEEDAVFPLPVVNGSINRMRKAGKLNFNAPGHPKAEGSWVTLMGLDPAMAGKTAAVMYAVNRETHKRYVLDVHNMSDPTPQKIRALIEEWVTVYRPQELRIEINAFQKAFALDDDLRQWLASRGTALREHFTGKNKWDVGFGVASMSSLFGSMRDGKFNKDNLIELPDNSNEHVKALVNQLITWKADTRGATDCVMALWFCEIRAKELILQSSRITSHIGNRYATRRNLAQQGIVNLDELAMEQAILL
jgi:hypothetical protein